MPDALSDQSESARERALTAVEEHLHDLIPEDPAMPEEWWADRADEIVALVERAFDEDRCRHARILEAGPAGRFCGECGQRIEVIPQPAFDDQEGRTEMTPIACCPVCGGNGLRPEGFYTTTTGVWGSSGTGTEPCRSCDGRGFIDLTRRAFNEPRVCERCGGQIIRSERHGEGWCVDLKPAFDEDRKPVCPNCSAKVDSPLWCPHCRLAFDEDRP